VYAPDLAVAADGSGIPKPAVSPVYVICALLCRLNAKVNGKPVLMNVLPAFSETRKESTPGLTVVTVTDP
jgi:hypothetical protein